MFNISEFKATMDKHGGLAKNSLFEVQIMNNGKIPTNISSDDLRFFCQAVNMPGVNLDVAYYKPTGVGYQESIPVGANLGMINAIFFLDSNHKVMSFFHSWINNIFNISGELGPNSRGLEPREINYKENYTTSLIIKHYSTHNKFQFYEAVYDGVYPTEVGALELSWGGDGPATLPISFSFNKMIYSGFRSGSFEQSRSFKGIQESLPRGNLPSITQPFIDNRTLA